MSATLPVAAVPTPAAAPQRSGHSVGHNSPLVAKIVSYALMGLVVVIYLYPLLFLINTALKSNAEFLVDPTGVVKNPQFGNFVAAWNKGNFATYVFNSVLYTLVAATLGHGDVVDDRVSGGPRLREASEGLDGPVRCDVVPAQHPGHGVPTGATAEPLRHPAGLHADHGFGRRGRPAADRRLSELDSPRDRRSGGHGRLRLPALHVHCSCRG